MLLWFLLPPGEANFKPTTETDLGRAEINRDMTYRFKNMRDLASQMSSHISPELQSHKMSQVILSNLWLDKFRKGIKGYKVSNIIKHQTSNINSMSNA